MGTLIGITVNAGKEVVYDKYMHKGVPSLGDGIVGSFGAITGGFIQRISIDLRQKKKERELYKLELTKQLL